jgi:hypothetical protein
MRAIYWMNVSMLLGFISLENPRAARGSIWVEAGDAGTVPSVAQTISGTGILTSIEGELLDELDVDVFKIVITGGGTFSASTVGLTAVDTKLFLFDSVGIGVYANDDANVFTLQSELPAGDPLTPAVGGEYFLAISGFDLDPISSGGRIFPDPLFPEELVGATGPGGGQAVTGFENTGDFGSYSISFTGALFVSTPGTGAIPEPSSSIIFGTLIVSGASIYWWRQYSLP